MYEEFVDDMFSSVKYVLQGTTFQKDKVEVESGTTKEDFDGFVVFSLFEDSLSGRDTDLTFQVGSDLEQVHAHSVVLKRMSAAFNVMLNDTWKRGQEIALPEDDPKDFRMFLKLLYGYKALKAEDYKDVFAVVVLADKYQSTHVQKALSEYTRNLAENELTVANVIPIYLSAKEFDDKDLKDLKDVKEAAKEFILKNINELWKNPEWLELDEKAVLWILSQDALCHEDSQTIDQEVGCECGSSMQKRYESKNEVLIFGKAIEWIKRQRRCKTEGTGEELEDGEKGDSLAMRVLEKVRFRHITHEDLDTAITQVQGVLTRKEMTNILLARYGVGFGSSEFVSFAKNRVLPAIELEQTQKCGSCRAYKLCRKNRSGYYRCQSCRSKGH